MSSKMGTANFEPASRRCHAASPVGKAVAGYATYAGFVDAAGNLLRSVRRPAEKTGRDTERPLTKGSAQVTQTGHQSREVAQPVEGGCAASAGRDGGLTCIAAEASRSSWSAR